MHHPLPFTGFYTLGRMQSVLMITTRRLGWDTVVVVVVVASICRAFGATL